MMQTIQFESVIEGGVIRVPDRYIQEIPSPVQVTLAPISGVKIKPAPKAEAGSLSFDHFSALKIDTKNWKFDREEANERR